MLLQSEDLVSTGEATHSSTGYLVSVSMTCEGPDETYTFATASRGLLVQY